MVSTGVSIISQDWTQKNTLLLWRGNLCVPRCLCKCTVLNKHTKNVSSPIHVYVSVHTSKAYKLFALISFIWHITNSSACVIPLKSYHYEKRTSQLLGPGACCAAVGLAMLAQASTTSQVQTTLNPDICCDHPPICFVARSLMILLATYQFYEENAAVPTCVWSSMKKVQENMRHICVRTQSCFPVQGHTAPGPSVSVLCT